MDERKLGWETCGCQVGALAVQPLSSRFLFLFLSLSFVVSLFILVTRIPLAAPLEDDETKGGWA